MDNEAIRNYGNIQIKYWHFMQKIRDEKLILKK